MALLDRCIFNASSGGISDFSIATAVTGYQLPSSAGAQNGQTYHYAAQSADLTQWEVGTGTYSASGPTLARTTILFNSLGTAAHINFNAAPQVMISALAEDFALTPATGNLTFYVATTGSDSNAGTLTAPFRTIQHAVSTAESFDYQSLYTCTINVADSGASPYNESILITSLLYGKTLGPTSPALNLIGNPTTPTNCVIAPTAVADTGKPTIFVSSTLSPVLVDGFSLVANTNGSGDLAMFVADAAFVCLGTLDFNTGTGQGYPNIFEIRNGSFVFGSFGSGSQAWSIHGQGTSISFSDVNDFSRFVLPAGGIIFNSTWAMPGTQFFKVRNFGFLDLTSLGGFTNPGNVTGGYPFSINLKSSVFIGQDPLTMTFPTGPFVASFAGSQVIDAGSDIDGFFYGQQIAGSPVDESTVYRGSWIINKDSTNGPRYISYDDAGTIHVRQIGRFINTQTTNYTLALFDQDGRVEMNLAGANTLTVPTNATVAFPIGTEVRIVQIGAGATTISGAGGVTVDNAGVVGGQWKSVMLYKRATNEWVQTNV